MPEVIKNINWKRWRLGLFVAALSGLCISVINISLIKEITLKEVVIISVIGAAKEVYQYLRNNPITDLRDENSAENVEKKELV